MLGGFPTDSDVDLEQILRLLAASDPVAAWKLAVEQSAQSPAGGMDVQLDVELVIELPANATWVGWAVLDMDTALRRAVAATDTLEPVSELLGRDRLPFGFNDSYSGLTLLGVEDGSIKFKFNPVDSLYAIAQSKPLVTLVSLVAAMQSLGFVVHRIEHIIGPDQHAIHQPAPSPPRIININGSATITINGQRVRIHVAPTKTWRNSDYHELKL